MLQSTAPKRATAAAVAVTDLPPHMFRAPDYTNLDLLDAISEDVNLPNPNGWDWWWNCPRCHLTTGPYTDPTEGTAEHDGHQCVLTPSPPNPSQRAAPWTAEEDDVVCARPVREVILLTGRTRNQVTNRRRTLTLQGRTVTAEVPVRDTKPTVGDRDHEEWTTEEDEIVASLSPAKAVLFLTGRSMKAALLRRRQLRRKTRKA